MPIDSWRPATASVPVASMVWMGLKRLPHRPFCGPLLSKFSANEKTFPLRMSRAALTISCGETLLSVPISSSAPQRPQFFNRSAAALMSLSVTLESPFAMDRTPHRGKLPAFTQTYRLPSYVIAKPTPHSRVVARCQVLVGQALLPVRVCGGDIAMDRHECLFYYAT